MYLSTFLHSSQDQEDRVLPCRGGTITPALSWIGVQLDLFRSFSPEKAAPPSLSGEKESTAAVARRRRFGAVPALVGAGPQGHDGARRRDQLARSCARGGTTRGTMLWPCFVATARRPPKPPGGARTLAEPTPRRPFATRAKGRATRSPSPLPIFLLDKGFFRANNPAGDPSSPLGRS
jgi:hypothetical protein